MEIKGKIIAVLPLQSGTSKQGKEWSKIDFVVETQEQYPKKVCISAMNDKIDQQIIQVGNDVKADFNIDAREWNGRWFNSLTLWRIEALNSQQPQQAQSQASQKTQDFMNNFGATLAQPQSQPQQQWQQNNNDGLPF